MNRIEEIDAAIGSLQEEKRAIQSACPHPPLVVRFKYGADTGNFCIQDDSYWTELRCTLCGKYWQMEGSINPGLGAKKIAENEPV